MFEVYRMENMGNWQCVIGWGNYEEITDNKERADALNILLHRDLPIISSKTVQLTNVNAQVVGPALANVDQRQTTDWIISFIHSPKTMIEKKDKDAVALYNQFNQIIMPDHQDLSSDDIKSVISYIKSETKTSTATEAPFVKPDSYAPNYYPLSIQKNYGFFISYLSAVLVLVLLLIFAVHVKGIQRKQ